MMPVRVLELMPIWCRGACARIVAIGVMPWYHDHHHQDASRRRLSSSSLSSCATSYDYDVQHHTSYHGAKSLVGSQWMRHVDRAWQGHDQSKATGHMQYESS